jgi:hypothetical protein
MVALATVPRAWRAAPAPSVRGSLHARCILLFVRWLLLV